MSVNFKSSSIIPQDQTYTCIGCGVEGRVALDKRGRPFWRCHLCGITLFLPTEVSQAGFMVFQKIAAKMKGQFRQLIISSLTHYQRKQARKVEKSPIEA